MLRMPTVDFLRRRFYIIWFIALAALVLGPLAAGGYLLLLDAPAGPNPEWPPFLAVPSEGISPSVPGLAIERLLGYAHPQLPNKLFIAAAVIVGGAGIYRFLTHKAGTAAPAAIVAATFFCINPWVNDRMVSGQLLLTGAYALLPWLLSSLSDVVVGLNKLNVARALGWCAAIGAVDIHVGGMAVLLLVAAIAFSNHASLGKLGYISVCLLVLVAINSFWIVPSLFVGEAARLGSGDLVAYAPRPRSARILPFVLTLHGFWRSEFDRAIDLYPARFFATFLPLVLAALYGLTRAISSKTWFRASSALASTCAIAIVLGMGRSFPPTRAIADWLFNNMPGYGIYREPQKWIAILALGYALFTGVGLDGIARRLEKVGHGTGRLVALAIALPLLASSVMLWGFGGRVHLSHFPQGWEEAEKITEGQDGNLLFLPWHHYQPLYFADFRIVANPAPDYFSSRVLISDDAQLFVREDTAPADPRDLYVAKLLRNRSEVEQFGHLVAPAGVRYVALAHVADFGSYKFLDRQSDLELVLSTDDMTLYQNLAFRGTSYGLTEASTASGLGQVLASAELQEKAASELQVFEASAASEPLPGPSFIQGVPGWDRIDGVDTPVVGTDKSCLDGWRLGNEDPVCHLGALAAYQSSGTDVRLWRPGVAVQAAAYLISIVAAGGLAMVILKTRRPNEKTPRTEWGSSPTSDGR
jgi:hypothetical protein